MCQGNSYFADGLYASDFNWIVDKKMEKFECYAKFRYRQEAKKVSVLVLDDNKVFVETSTGEYSGLPLEVDVYYSSSKTKKLVEGVDYSVTKDDSLLESENKYTLSRLACSRLSFVRLLSEKR